MWIGLSLRAKAATIPDLCRVTCSSGWLPGVSGWSKRYALSSSGFHSQLSKSEETTRMSDSDTPWPHACGKLT
eukprot:2353725-Prymnesium_polylepis.1